MDNIMIERTVYDAMVADLKECRQMLTTALCRLSHNRRQEWIDNNSTQNILRRSNAQWRRCVPTAKSDTL